MMGTLHTLKDVGRCGEVSPPFCGVYAVFVVGGYWYGLGYDRQPSGRRDLHLNLDLVLILIWISKYFEKYQISPNILSRLY